MDETYIRVKGQWCYLYRATDKTGQTIDFLLTEHRDEHAARHFLAMAIRRHGVPETVTTDGSTANATAIRSYNDAHGTTIAVRQVKYLSSIIEQDHRMLKRITRPILGFKSVEAAQCSLASIELMHLIHKGQLASGAAQTLTASASPC
jgi:putative transposase